MKTTNSQSHKSVPYTYIENDSTTLCIMLCGSNYRYDKPIMYYAKMAMLENHVDIIQVHYAYEPKIFEKDSRDLSNIMVEDIDSVLDDVLASKTYTQIIFLGKSLGTLPISFKYSIDSAYSNSKIISLTPLLQFEGLYENVMASSSNTLMVIGTNDGHYVPEKIEHLRSKKGLKLLEIEQANHSLDIEPVHTTRSLQALTTIIDAIHDFVQL